ncbi:Crp/Fnr family transcriptional regulator [Haliangium sp.]|uniref:Crp/Fnr family transcriptional regulator n=1 Tax=Haliangium sp. TaxID=2663208 RepID=UPI003D0CC2F3
MDNPPQGGRPLDSEELAFLRELSIFAGLHEDVLARIAAAAEHVDIPDDRVLFSEGTSANLMAVVTSGTLEVRKRSNNGVESCIATLGAGDVVGEMALFDIQPRSADVWARGPTSLVLVRHGVLADLYRDDPESYILLILNIARELSLRLRRFDEAMTNIMGHIRAATGVVYSPILRARVPAASADGSDAAEASDGAASDAPEGSKPADSSRSGTT